MIAVWDDAGLLGSAVAELPLSARRAKGPADAVAVVDSVPGAPAALASGALGVVLVSPMTVRLEGVSELLAASAGSPVIVLRSRLAAIPRVTAAAFVAECSAPAAQLEAVLRDALGWMRGLGGELQLDTAAVSEGAAIALLHNGAGIPSIVTARTLSGVPGGGVIRVVALASERCEVEVDEPAGVFRVVIEREGESATRGPGFESHARQALRRIISAVGSAGPSTEFAQLLHDSDLAREILAAK